MINNKAGLPVGQFKTQILAAVAANSVTIITAETGAGKSTQVPQYLLEAGYEVVVTQPRRLAASSLAERVAEEFGCELGEEIGFRTALDRADSEKTRCLFVTDGLQLVRELMKGMKGNKRVLVLDEVHEWNLNIETLVAWVRSQVDGGVNFKVVLMSATLEAQALSAFYSGAPVIEVPGRLFPVTTRSPAQYLVNDVEALVAEGRNVLVFQPGKAEIETMIAELLRREVSAEILPLHGELTAAEQKKCFAHYGRPKVVVSTNVAQTSVTIDDVDAVVDSGMERRVELVNGVEGLYLRAISLADSKQRAGRAGRTKPGVYIDHCGTHDRRNFPVAEIERVRLDQTVLRLAMAGFDMEELRFFHQPDIMAIHQARESLMKLGCMSPDGRVTQIGKQVSRFPVSVQYGRMIVEATRLNVVSDVVLAAALLETGEINTRKDKDGYPSTTWRNHIGNERQSDVIAQMQLYRAAEQMRPGDRFDEGIHPKAFQRVKDLCKQISSSLESRGVEMTSTGRREDIVLAICAGMVDHLYTISYGSLTNGQSRERNRESVVMLPSIGFAVGLPFDLEINTRRGTMVLALVRMLTLVSAEQLMQVAPQLIEEKKGLNPRLDTDGKVVSTTETWFNGHKITEMIVSDKHHEQAHELLVEYSYRNFQYPTRERLDITEETQVPEVVEVIVGTHPRTGEQLVAYGYYQKEYWYNQLAGKWTCDREEAERVNAETINQVQAAIEYQQECKAANAPEEARREAEAKAQAEAEAEQSRKESFQTALENAEWKVHVAKSESNRYHGDGVLIAEDGSLIESDGRLRNSGSPPFVSLCYVSVPETAVAVSWAWDNRESSVHSAEFTVAFEPDLVNDAQLAAMTKIEKERGLRPQALTDLFKKRVVQQSLSSPSSSDGVSQVSLDALCAKFAR